MTAQRNKDPWGDPIKAAASENKPSRPAHRFGPVPKIEGARNHDAWGDPLPARGMPVAQFSEAVRAAQERIFEKARPSRTSDEDAARYVVVLTSRIREWCKTDADFVAELQKMADRSHKLTAELGAKQPARSEARRGPFGTVAQPGPGGKTIFVKEGTSR